MFKVPIRNQIEIANHIATIEHVIWPIHDAFLNLNLQLIVRTERTRYWLRAVLADSDDTLSFHWSYPGFVGASHAIYHLPPLTISAGECHILGSHCRVQSQYNCEAWTKWPPFCRRNFQIPGLNGYIFIYILVTLTFVLVFQFVTSQHDSANILKLNRRHVFQCIINAFSYTIWKIYICLHNVQEWNYLMY